MKNEMLFLILFLVFISCNKNEVDSKIDENLDEGNKAAIQLFIFDNYKEKLKRYNTYMPNNYRIVMTNTGANVIEGDFNRDSIIDFAAIITEEGDTPKLQNAKEVKLVIYEGQKNNSYIQVSQTGNLTPENYFSRKSK